MSVVESVRERLLSPEGIRMGNDRVKPVPLTQNVVHDLLGSDRRRLAISFLVRDADGRCTMSELSEYVAAVENGLDAPEDLTSNMRKRVYVSLYQTHLPKLEEAGIVEYDDTHAVVTATDLASEFIKIDRALGCVAGGVPQ